MDESRLKRMKDKAVKIREDIREYAETPDGKALNTRMKLARNIIALLKSKKLSQAEFAQNIGMKPTQFSRIVQGDENITLAMMTRLADGFGVPESRLLRESHQPREAVGAGK